VADLSRSCFSFSYQGDVRVVSLDEDLAEAFATLFVPISWCLEALTGLIFINFIGSSDQRGKRLLVTSWNVSEM
jgi:hypothetical protein